MTSALARKQDVTAACALERDYPPHEPIVRRAMRTGAALIFSECHKGQRRASWLIQARGMRAIAPAPIVSLSA